MIDLHKINKKEFYSQNIFHERQMNSCPIGCKGCAVSASTSAKGSMSFSQIDKFYNEAAELGISLQITKVEGYDPVFVNYTDSAHIPFAQSVKLAKDLGHQIITPVCTTGSWKSPRTIWQVEELGKLDDSYRYYRYPSGNEGVGFVLSVPREINPFQKTYDQDEHLNKLEEDINLLAANGQLDVLIYYNNHILGDQDFAHELKANLEAILPATILKRTNLLVTNFNSETLPESCFRYPNSILVSDQGFQKINPKTLTWDFEVVTVNETGLQNANNFARI